MTRIASETALRSNWRKVSSTDNLQAFSNHGQEDKVAQETPGCWAVGLGMVLLGVMLLVGELSVVVAKLWSHTWGALNALHADSYYVYLVPLMVPISVLAVTLNWFSLKLFKHNS